jgi:hypothetical protein
MTRFHLILALPLALAACGTPVQSTKAVAEVTVVDTAEYPKELRAGYQRSAAYLAARPHCPEGSAPFPAGMIKTESGATLQTFECREVQ